ncbi:hypothetical protein AB4Z09_10855 [Rhodococcus sp. TAF43]|uniref:hypothetical protein n=1 Tax=unclassified Rhodococcus (in: high G+C Gram-positive bacteria) TaxID=192944 RepID=UPI001582DC69|nr:hypothetical protein [Rhodococcus sp. W8901]QKT11726.1 hypothetical protein HUN07_14215 [Rhodococcus sp. W8901]
MGVNQKTIAFDVIERREVPQPEIDRLARSTWQSLTAATRESCEPPRWVNSGPVAGADAYLVHRYEGTVAN